jgi:hypothetical protein
MTKTRYERSLEELPQKRDRKKSQKREYEYGKYSTSHPNKHTNKHKHKNHNPKTIPKHTCLNQENDIIKKTLLYIIWENMSKKMTKLPFASGATYNGDDTWKRIYLTLPEHNIFSQHLFGEGEKKKGGSEVTISTDLEVESFFPFVRHFKEEHQAFSKLVAPMRIRTTANRITIDFRYTVYLEKGKEASWIQQHRNRTARE